MNFESFPENLQEEILFCLPFPEVLIFGQVSSRYRRLIQGKPTNVQTWTFYREKAQRDLDLNPRDFDHDGVSPNPVERYLQFYTYRRGYLPSRFGLSSSFRYASKLSCSLRALRNQEPPIRNSRDLTEDQEVILEALLLYPDQLDDIPLRGETSPSLLKLIRPDLLADYVLKYPSSPRNLLVTSEIRQANPDFLHSGLISQLPFGFAISPSRSLIEYALLSAIQRKRPDLISDSLSMLSVWRMSTGTPLEPNYLSMLLIFLLAYRGMESELQTYLSFIDSNQRYNLERTAVIQSYAWSRNLPGINRLLPDAHGSFLLRGFLLGGHLDLLSQFWPQFGNSTTTCDLQEYAIALGNREILGKVIKIIGGVIEYNLPGYFGPVMWSYYLPIRNERLDLIEELVSQGAQIKHLLDEARRQEKWELAERLIERWGK